MTEHSTHHDIWKLYNNIGIGVIALSSVMEHMPKITLTNALLILPLITHTPTLSYLSRKTTNIPSSSSLLISHPELFINFLCTRQKCSKSQRSWTRRQITY